jgi:3-hydroxyisobutyrate dehydrogenase-like beta-hydroxyacid dehydrogenase
LTAFVSDFGFRIFIFGEMMANLGFVGLGVMGSRMAKRLLDAGHSVTGYNRTKSKAQWLLDAGMNWADSPRAAAGSSDVVFSMIANNSALRAITEGNDGIVAGLSAGKIYVEMSTVSPAAIRELAKQVETKGAEMLDAPVSGSSITLAEGKLSFMVGGKRETFDKVLPYLQAIGPKATYVGGHGLAASMKIATNLSLAVQMLAFSEGLLLAEKSGIARETAVEVLLNSVMASPMVKYRGPFVLKMPDEAVFDVNMMQKDLLLALEMGRELNIPLPTTSITNEFLTAARGMGLAEKDFAIVFEVLARMAGVK